VALAHDPAGAHGMGAKGREYVVEHFNRQKIAERLRALLRETARRPA
jgi:glycosyltransferase involved in cell wall biosynthesis